MRDYINRKVVGAYVTDDAGMPTAVDIVDHLGASLLDPLPAAPAVIGTIMDRVYVVGSGPYTIDLATKFSGATSYLVTPMVAGLLLEGPILTIDPATPLAQTTITVRSIGIGGMSEPITFALTIEEAAPDPTVPEAPVLALVARTSDSITIGWPAPADGGSAITGYRLYANGTLAVASATSPQQLVDLEPETEYSLTVSALSAVGEGQQSAPLVVATEAADPDPDPEIDPHALGWGYLPDRDEGTAGNWFVAPDGSDGAAGTVEAPFATIQKALDSAAPGDVIRLRGGVYRQSFDFAGKGGLPGARTTVARYGAEQVIISGADAVTGWAACTVDDLDVVGPNWPHVHKATLPIASFSGANPRAANIFAGGRLLTTAAAKVPAPQYPAYDKFQGDWLTAAEVVTEEIGGEIIIKGHRLPALTDLYTQAQIERCDIAYHCNNNSFSRRPVTSFDPATKTIETANAGDWYAGNDKRDRFALFNLLPAMRRGQWGYEDRGDGTATLYVWPHDPADIALVEVAARGIGARIDTSHVELRGLIFERQASPGERTDGVYAVTAASATWTEDAVVDNVMIRDTLRTASGSYAPLLLNNVNDWRAVNIQIERARGQFGFFGFGSVYPNMASGGVMDRFIIRETEHGAFRLYGQQNARITRGQANGCGMSTHSNKASNYESCSNVLYWGVDWSGSGGYFAWQEASGIHLAFCCVPGAYEQSARGVQNQNHDSDGAPATKRGEIEHAYLINNAVAPFRDFLGYGNGLSLNNRTSDPGNPYDPLARLVVCNNITHGIDDGGNLVDDRRGNHITTAANAGSVYADLVRGDISIRPDSPTWDETGADLTEIIAALQALHPDFDGFDRDLAGQPFDAANPPVGPYAAPATLPLPATWIEAPTITGVPVVGEPLSLTEGYLMGSPYPARSQQWLRSGDGGATWQAIPGATGTTYTPDEADEGLLIGAELAHGARAALAVPVVDGYPIDTPQLLAIHSHSPASNSAVATETATFTSTGKPLLVLASMRAGSSADAVMTVTVGAPGRAMGTGTPLMAGPHMRHTSNQTGVFVLLDPPVGEVTVQMTADLVATGRQVQVYDVDGLAGLGATPAAAGTGSTTSRTPSVTTTGHGSGVLYIINRFDGSLENPITMTGMDAVLSNANTGGVSASGDLMICVGWSRAAAPGNHASSATWPTARTAIARAIELLSVAP